MGNMDKIVITGIPGTGKTTVAERISEVKGLEVTHVDSNFIQEKGLSIGKDEPRQSEEVDLEKLKETLIPIKGIIESHLLCEFHLPDSIPIVLRCRPDVLKERLKKRGYSDEKIQENIEAEAIDYCVQRTKENYGESYEVETTSKEVEETVKECIKVVDGESKGDKDIDYSDYLISSL